MAKSNKQINKEAGMNADDSSPAVVAYRMGQLEKVVKEGFESHNDKLDGLIKSFATKEELNVIRGQLNDWRWYFRALISAVFLALATSLFAFFVRKP